MNFTGVSGRVHFDPNGERKPSIAVLQYNSNWTHVGGYVPGPYRASAWDAATQAPLTPAELLSC